MKISLYTAAKNAIVNDLHAEAMVRHHLPLADEIVVNEGHSVDDTYERISNIDSKVRVFRSEWQEPKDLAWCIGFKDAARRACTGDWCIHLDCDEFIPEWEFESIRAHLEKTDEILVPVSFTNFYGNYRVYHARPEKVNWPTRKMIIHRNIQDIEFWGDGSNVRIRDRPFDWDCSSASFSVHHFGMVRDPAILRSKWWVQGRAVAGKNTKLKPPAWIFNLFPHNWLDPQFADDLAIYDGPLIRAVLEDPTEFQRDGMKLLRSVSARNGSGRR